MTAIPKLAFVMTVMSLLTLTIVNIVEPASAQLPEKDPGASFFAPKEDPSAPGWDPDRAEEDAPGHLKCNELKCNAGEDSPGSEALKSGIIGPM